ncbi:hypothetical protein [Actinoallomurus sp. NPDC050550]|uniref:hypothetical protein n=1 Tax=Actinoallomurus sp. NPDC050550 TaxID=3154937 RepID=UPI0033E30836
MTSAEEFADDLLATIRHIAEQLPALYCPATTRPDLSSTTYAIGELAVTDDRAERIALLRGCVHEPGPLLVVHTTVLDPEQLATSLHYGDQPHTAAQPRDDDELRRLQRHLPTRPREAVDLPVDHAPASFTVRGAGATWYGWTRLPDDTGLVIEAVDIAPRDVRIEQVTDLTPCLDGLRALIGG